MGRKTKEVFTTVLWHRKAHRAYHCENGCKLLPEAIFLAIFLAASCFFPLSNAFAGLELISGRVKALSYHDVSKGKLYFSRHEKLVPLAINFLECWEQGRYSELSAVLKGYKIFLGREISEFAYIDKTRKKIVIDKDFCDFLLESGRKRITMAFFAEIAEAIRNSDSGVNSEAAMRIARQSLIAGSRLDDTKKLYRLKKRVLKNEDKDYSREFFLSLEDRTLFLADLLHRSKMVSAESFRQELLSEYGFYGFITVEQAKQELDSFVKKYADIVAGFDFDGQLLYGFTASYQSNPIFKGRMTLWDLEVEKADEVDFGGKSALTGEMMFAPYSVTMANFFTSGTAFNYLLTYNTKKLLKNNILNNIGELENLLKSGNLKRKASDLPEELKRQLSNMRVMLGDDSEGTADLQVSKAISILRKIGVLLERFNAFDLAGYLNRCRKELNYGLRHIKSLYGSGQISSAGYNEQYDKLTGDFSSYMLYAVRNASVPEGLEREIKENIRQLAVRAGTDVGRLLLAVRSSSVGEDSWRASFAGQQDTYLSVKAIPSSIDPEGLNAVINSWVFNQASIFNKRALRYRLDKGLAVYDDNIKMNTMFQELFSGEVFFQTLTVDRVTGYPEIIMTATKKEGANLVSGKVTGSQFVASMKGEILSMDQTEDAGKNTARVEKKYTRLTDLLPESKSGAVAADKELIIKAAGYIRELTGFFGMNMDIEGAFGSKEDSNNKTIPFGKNGDEWAMVTFQARPERMNYNSAAQDTVRFNTCIVTDAEFKRAERQDKILPFDFVGKSGGSVAGEILKVFKGDYENIAAMKGKIILVEQSTPELVPALARVKGIIAIKGGQGAHLMKALTENAVVNLKRAPSGLPTVSRRHTVIENGPVALVGTDAKLFDILKNADKVTLDGQRGKILLGDDYEIRKIGNDFNIRELPVLRGIRLGALTDKDSIAKRQWPLRNWPPFLGTMLSLRAVSEEIGNSLESILAFDAYMGEKDEKIKPVKEKALLEVLGGDPESFIQLERKIQGYESGKTFYQSRATGVIQTFLDALSASDMEIKILYQQIKDRGIRGKVKRILNEYYSKKSRPGAYVKELLALARQCRNPDRDYIISIADLLDKGLYIILDDQGKGLRFLLDSPGLLKPQLEIIRDIVKKTKNKITILADGVTNSKEISEWFSRINGIGLTADKIRKGLLISEAGNNPGISGFLRMGVDSLVVRMGPNWDKQENLKVYREISGSVKERMAQKRRFIELAAYCDDSNCIKEQTAMFAFRNLGYNHIFVPLQMLEAAAKSCSEEGGK